MDEPLGGASTDVWNRLMAIGHPSPAQLLEWMDSSDLRVTIAALQRFAGAIQVKALDARVAVTRRALVEADAHGCLWTALLDALAFTDTWAPPELMTSRGLKIESLDRAHRIMAVAEWAKRAPSSQIALIARYDYTPLVEQALRAASTVDGDLVEALAYRHAGVLELVLRDQGARLTPDAWGRVARLASLHRSRRAADSWPARLLAAVDVGHGGLPHEAFGGALDAYKGSRPHLPVATSAILASVDMADEDGRDLVDTLLRIPTLGPEALESLAAPIIRGGTLQTMYRLLAHPSTTSAFRMIVWESCSMAMTTRLALHIIGQPDTTAELLLLALPHLDSGTLEPWASVVRHHSADSQIWCEVLRRCQAEGIDDVLVGLGGPRRDRGVRAYWASRSSTSVSVLRKTILDDRGDPGTWGDLLHRLIVGLKPSSRREKILLKALRQGSPVGATIYPVDLDRIINSSNPHVRQALILAAPELAQQERPGRHQAVGDTGRV